eukprot:jgi/Hompol1/2219/HPOL_005890-RA
MVCTLKVSGLSKKLPDGRVLFNGVSFSMDDSDGPFVLALRGPSGAGKTTLLKCLAQLLPYEQGTMKLNEKEPSQYGVPDWRSRVLYVPQRPPVLDGTPREFIKIISGFGAQKRHSEDGISDPIEIAAE